MAALIQELYASFLLACCWPIATASVLNGTGPFCLSCRDISQPRHCPYVAKCAMNELCGVEKYITSNGDTRFNVGCKAKHLCNQNSGSDHSSSICVECETGDLSNAKGCGEPGYPAYIGPVCMDCDRIRDPSLCNKIKVCADHEACHIQEIHEFSDLLYTSICKPKHECGPLLGTSSVFGKKRSFDKRGAICSQCCEQNLCNAECHPPDPCGSSPCLHGNCSSTLNGQFSCTCDQGWTGALCDTDIDECTNSHACAHGHCTNTLGSFTCTCSSGWTGTKCDIDIDECMDSQLCTHGTCTNTLGSYNCSCYAGLSGPRCDIDIDECADPFICVHGNCTNLVGGYTCGCNKGWSGITCNKDVDECLSNPCVHAICTNVPGNYSCHCNKGWQGPNCQTDIDECTPDPCVHGNCSNRIGSYACNCHQGWTGVNCTQDINECAFRRACVHGVCHNTVGSYRCTSCSPGWTGPSCNTSNVIAQCDFESSSICGFKQDHTDTFDWTRNSGSTSSTDTGPSRDHSSSGSYYMYIETSSPRRNGDTARLISPLYSRGPACLKFWYHMYGAEMGYLRVYIYHSGIHGSPVWYRHGNQGNTWHQASVSITYSSYNVVFEGVRGAGYYSDAAIDDVTITPGSCH